MFSLQANSLLRQIQAVGLKKLSVRAGNDTMLHVDEATIHVVRTLYNAKLGIKLARGNVKVLVN